MAAFRQHFSLPVSSTAANLKLWFPRHMYSGLKHMQARLRAVDAVVEVHDARIPFTGRNPIFSQSLYGAGTKPHILVLNKKDLIDQSLCGKIEQNLTHNDPSIKYLYWANCKTWTCNETLNMLKLIKETLTNWPRYNRDYRSDYNVMVIGIPNVGKSSLINAVRTANLNRGKATKVGAQPGVTKCVLNKIAVCENPKMFLVDTPGVLPPSAKDLDGAMKLALCETVLESTIGIEAIADYLLFYLNKRQDFRYVQHFDLRSPSDDIFSVLVQIAKNLRLIRTLDGAPKPNLDAAATSFVGSFRNGALAKNQFLDFDFLEPSVSNTVRI